MQDRDQQGWRGEYGRERDRDHEERAGWRAESPSWREDQGREDLRGASYGQDYGPGYSSQRYGGGQTYSHSEREYGQYQPSARGGMYGQTSQYGQGQSYGQYGQSQQYGQGQYGGQSQYGQYGQSQYGQGQYGQAGQQSYGAGGYGTTYGQGGGMPQQVGHRSLPAQPHYGQSQGQGAPHQLGGGRGALPFGEDSSYAPGSQIWAGGRTGRGVEFHSQHGEFEPDYLHWRDEQIQNLDRDYHGWREERRAKFSRDFDSWRKERQSRTQGQGQGQTQAGMSGSSGASAYGQSSQTSQAGQGGMSSGTYGASSDADQSSTLSSSKVQGVSGGETDKKKM